MNDDFFSFQQIIENGIEKCRGRERIPGVTVSSIN